MDETDQAQALVEARRELQDQSAKLEATTEIMKSVVATVVGAPAKPLKKAAPVPQALSDVDMHGMTATSRNSVIWSDDIWGTGYNAAMMKPGLGFEMLREMARRCEVIQAIVLTRQNQVVRYCRPKREWGDMGFEIIHRDPKHKTTDKDRKVMGEITEWISNCGDGGPKAINERGYLGRVRFKQFVRKIVDDRLVLDAVAFEKNRRRNGKLYELLALDAATIRRTNPDRYQVQLERTPSNERVYFVQMVSGVVRAEYNVDDIAYGIGNPRTDIGSCGYGRSELEAMIGLVTGILFGLQFNMSAFSNNSIPKGVLSLIGNYDSETLEDFRRRWAAQVMGIGNAHRLPIFAMDDGKGFQWTAMHSNSRDMEYHQWLTFLIAAACAVYQMHPSELGFPEYSGGQKSMIDSEPFKTKVDFSTSKGLAPLMQWLADEINHHVIEQTWPDFRLAWSGINLEEEEKKLQLRKTKIDAALATVNEQRAEMDLPAFDEWGDVPAHPILFQAWMQLNASQDQGEPEGEAPEQGGVPSWFGGVPQEQQEVVKAVAAAQLGRKRRRRAITIAFGEDDDE